MILGYCKEDETPHVTARLVFPVLGVGLTVDLLVDTGSFATILHPGDVSEIRFPFDELRNEVIVTGISGTQTYYAEPAVISFYDGERAAGFSD